MMRSPDGAWEKRVFGGLLTGDVASLAEAYDSLAPLVYGIALHSTGDQAAAEKLTERTFLRLWERPMEFAPDRGPLGVLVCERTLQWAIEHRHGDSKASGLRSR